MIVVAIIFCRSKKINFWEWADLTVVPLSVCLMLGRIGNFLNGELYGRLSDGKRQILDGKLELYTGNARERAGMNIAYAREVAGK